MAEKEADKKVQTEEVPTTQVLQENEDDSMKTQLNEAVSLDLKKLKATVDKTSDSKINEEQEDVEETKDEEKETKDEKEENKEGEGKSKEVSEVEDKKEEGAEAEDKEEEGTEAEDKEKEGAEAEDKKKEGSEAEDKEEEGTEAEDKEKEGAEAEYKNKEGTGAEVKTEEGAESNFELGAVRRRKKKEGTESLQYRLKVCQGNKDGRHGTRGPTLESGSDRTQRQRRRVSKKIYVCYDRDACLYAHNKARDCHKLSMLTWDTKLAEDAKNWAIHLVENNLFCHQGGVGENLYEMPYSEKCHRVYHAVYDQYNEIEDYDFNNPRKYETDDCEFKKIGHFSQIVWKETTKIGCCVAFDKDSKRTVIVTRFDPMQGYAFTEQVPRCRPAKIPSTVEDFINEYDVPPSLEGVEGYML